MSAQRSGTLPMSAPSGPGTAPWAAPHPGPPCTTAPPSTRTPLRPPCHPTTATRHGRRPGTAGTGSGTAAASRGTRFCLRGGRCLLGACLGQGLASASTAARWATLRGSAPTEQRGRRTSRTPTRGTGGLRARPRTRAGSGRGKERGARPLSASGRPSAPQEDRWMPGRHRSKALWVRELAVVHVTARSWGSCLALGAGLCRQTYATPAISLATLHASARSGREAASTRSCRRRRSG